MERGNKMKQKIFSLNELEDVKGIFFAIGFMIGLFMLSILHLMYVSVLDETQKAVVDVMSIAISIFVIVIGLLYMYAIKKMKMLLYIFSPIIALVLFYLFLLPIMQLLVFLATICVKAALKIMVFIFM